MQSPILESLQAIRDTLSDADERTTITPAQIGAIIIATGQLADLVERLYMRIVDLERVQNERGDE